MMKILITGANGFIGKNLFFHLKNLGYNNIVGISSQNAEQDLENALSDVDFIFHLAGVNRPKDSQEYWNGNYGLTEKIASYLRLLGKNTPVIFTSSIQAELENEYGRSKKAAEEVLKSYAFNTGAAVVIYRLPNVFGKWCRPNYNSVVATFCYNIARDLPIEIHDPAKELSLVYVDDVVGDFVKTMHKIMQPCDQKSPVFYTPNGEFNISIYKVTLQQLADKLYAFKQSRDTLLMPSLDSKLNRKLYATFVSYLPVDQASYPLMMKLDHRGWLAEIIKSHSFGQIFVSRTKPGVTRGNHWHQTKVEKFIVIHGEALVKLRNISSGQFMEYKVSSDKLQVIDIPPGYTHSIANIGQDDLITVFWADEIFDPENPDTYYMEA
jgi:UDP-2-acetamido-2,6-beta-L-arabino-hexul-4-ose reductase